MFDKPTNLHNVRKTVDKSRILRFYIYAALPRKMPAAGWQPCEKKREWL